MAASACEAPIPADADAGLGSWCGRAGDWFVLNQVQQRDRSVSYTLLASKFVSRIASYTKLGGVAINMRKPLKFSKQATIELGRCRPELGSGAAIFIPSNGGITSDRSRHTMLVNYRWHVAGAAFGTVSGFDCLS